MKTLELGGYTLLGWPYRGAFVFLAGSYLRVIGIALALGGVASVVVAAVGAGVFVLGVVAVVSSVRSLVVYGSTELLIELASTVPGEYLSGLLSTRISLGVDPEMTCNRGQS
ncbi:MAG: hypothetical protein ABEH88_10110 [Halobacteriales archaeon]